MAARPHQVVLTSLLLPDIEYHAANVPDVTDLFIKGGAYHHL